MEPKTIVAIEIASSKIKGAAGVIGPDGNLTVLDVEEIGGLNNVRYGRVQNIREVSAAVNEIIRRLETSPSVRPRRVRALAVGLGGRSLSGTPTQAAIKFPRECEITEKQVERLAFEATNDFVGDKNIEATVPRVFYVNNAAVRRPVGTFGESFRGEFVMISCGKETRQNLDRIKYESIDAGKISYVIRPTAVADLVLSSDEKELGTALVDIGAETTTVAVYKDGTLASVCTIPMGARLITLDLMAGFNITEEAAEAMKIAFVNKGDVADPELVEAYVNSRAGEVAANVLAQLNNAGYSGQTLTKIVLTGGGSNIGAFASQLTAQSKIPTRLAELPRDIAFRVAGRNTSENIDIVALLYAGSRKIEESCLTPIAAPAPPTTSIFDDKPAVASDLEEEKEETAQNSVADNNVTEIYSPLTPGRREIDEDDPDLCADDPEEEEEEEKPRRGFSFFGRRNKNKQAEPKEKEKENKVHAEQPQRRAVEPVYNDPDGEDPFGDSEEDADDEVFEEDRPTSTERASETIDALRSKICKLFSPTNAEAEENDDSDDI